MSDQADFIRAKDTNGCWFFFRTDAIQIVREYYENRSCEIDLVGGIRAVCEIPIDQLLAIIGANVLNPRAELIS